MAAEVTNQMHPFSSPDSTSTQKISGYHSVRRAAGADTASPSTVPDSRTAQTSSIQRSRSRYHKRPSKRNPLADSPHGPDTRGEPMRSPDHHLASLAALTGEEYPQKHQASTAVAGSKDACRSHQNLGRTPERSPTKGSVAQSPSPVYYEAVAVQEGLGQELATAANDGRRTKRYGAQDRESRDHNRKQKLKSPTNEDSNLRRLHSTKEGLGSEPTRCYGEREPPVSPGHRGGKASRPSNTCAGVRGNRPPPETAEPTLSKTSTTQWFDAPVRRPVPKPAPAVLPPRYDAPVSAVNAGERHVTVRYENSTTSLSVTPSTTSRNLMIAAAAAMSEPIDLSCHQLVESFAQLGLERPLRQYEHVRDVMNSWDYDGQNTFMLLPATNIEKSDGLDARSAPRLRPEDTSVSMHHSQQPGRWDRRWITLRTDGQVTVAKGQGQESFNICHLTDFDIYVPTYRQQKKRIKPPRKICFAVKSQQKANVFLDGANYIHFFATNHRKVAQQWYEAVKSWRSWYLVHVLDEGQKASARAFAGNASIQRSTSKAKPRTAITAHNSSPADLSATKGVTAARATKSADLFHSRKLSKPDRAPPPCAFPTQTGRDADPSMFPVHEQRSAAGPDSGEMDDAAFAPTGLLGRTYSQRQKTQNERNPQTQTERHHSPRISDPPSAGLLGRRASVKSVTSPPRQMPKPLVDLTPQYQEPPQHIKKGRGVAAEPGHQLVNAATGINLPPGVSLPPSATAWQRPQPHPHPHTADHDRFDPNPTSSTLPRSTSKLHRTSSTKYPSSHRPHRSLTNRIHGSSGQQQQQLPQSSAPATTTPTPLLDLSTPSDFVEGSLLRKNEERGIRS